MFFSHLFVSSVGLYNSLTLSGKYSMWHIKQVIYKSASHFHLGWPFCDKNNSVEHNHYGVAFNDALVIELEISVPFFRMRDDMTCDCRLCHFHSDRSNITAEIRLQIRIRCSLETHTSTQNTQRRARVHTQMRMEEATNSNIIILYTLITSARTCPLLCWQYVRYSNMRRICYNCFICAICMPCGPSMWDMSSGTQTRNAT